MNNYFKLLVVLLLGIIALVAYLLIKDTNIVNPTSPKINIMNETPGMVIGWSSEEKVLELLSERRLMEGLTNKESPDNPIQVKQLTLKLVPTVQSQLITSVMLNETEKVTVVTASQNIAGDELVIQINVNEEALNERVVEGTINSHINNIFADAVIMASQSSNKSVEELRRLSGSDASNISDLNSIDIYDRYLRENNSAFINFEGLN